MSGKLPRSSPTRSRGTTSLPETSELQPLSQAFYHGDYARLEKLALSLTQRYPQFAPGWKALGVALKQSAKSASALTPLQRAVALDPQDVENHCNLAIVLKGLRRRDEALASFKRALILDQHHVLTLTSLARLYIDEGDMPRAATLAAKATAIAPHHPDVLVLHSFLGKLTTADAAWCVQVSHAIDHPQTTVHQRAQLCFALGKYHDDIKNYATAFACYQAANALRKMEGVAYDPVQMEHLTDRIIATNTVQTIATRQKGANLSERPLFIVGMPRAGTSLLEQILASHPDVHGAGELAFWTHVLQIAPQVLTSPSHSSEWIASVAAEYLKHLDQHNDGALRVIDKFPGNFQRLGLIHTIFPQARILHLHRNPVDTCLSIYFQDFHVGHPYACDLTNLAHYYGEYRRLMAHWRSVLPSSIFLDVTYEDLLDDLEGWSRLIFDFAGLTWSKHCLEFHNIKRRIGTASNWQARQPIYHTSRERWRNYAEWIIPLQTLLVPNQLSRKCPL